MSVIYVLFGGINYNYFFVNMTSVPPCMVYKCVCDTCVYT